MSLCVQCCGESRPPFLLRKGRMLRSNARAIVEEQFHEDNVADGPSPSSQRQRQQIFESVMESRSEVYRSHGIRQALSPDVSGNSLECSSFSFSAPAFVASRTIESGCRHMGVY